MTTTTTATPNADAADQFIGTAPGRNYQAEVIEAARMAAALPLPKERSVVNPGGWLRRGRAAPLCRGGCAEEKHEI